MLFLKGFLFPFFFAILALIVDVYIVVFIFIFVVLFFIYDRISDKYEILSNIYVFLCFCVFCGLLSELTAENSRLKKAVDFIAIPVVEYVDFFDSEYPFIEDLGSSFLMSDDS